MIRSMTGFGRGNSEKDGKSFTIEIKSVNHRYFETNIRMPRVLISFEDKIRKIIGEKVKRGKLDVFVTQGNYDKEDVEAYLNENLAASYINCLGILKDKYGLSDDISVAAVAKLPEVITLKQKEEDVSETFEQIDLALTKALRALLFMREREGRKLLEDVIIKCDLINGLVDKVKTRAPLVVCEYKAKLTQRLDVLHKEIDFDENRVAMEIAIFADKAGIDEEIVRLNSHINQMRETLILDEPIGRKLDFIIQEMNRETNTIASKANDLEILNTVISMKSEIEKIREQIQNIE
ncbi:YicC/YloC family endoribonuclease [Clostridium estertheticum]|uniref:YicC family protein n=1 Tax=Clostridium estertheticum subsp. estertheticum TaxID=1552 RepID=A0A1J0GHV8_9CLOT|nr:YicC/YloC family endoribonuclease [Clostridium estertheticum]APC40980.1 YicC family protein [Clostridium estertheticum subsp. estertheticum]MBZ9617151.1 YicC family protein [Clostridium estertheticum subsp. laramiense]MCB2355411.1 YicC family protein [Clostridium estertheticum]WAG42899.1 YicC family protein [Clostridium estertheticum]WAG72843.1 YicC family protein [Clostridium estertheticum]